MGDTVKKYYEDMSDREIMNVKNPSKKIQEYIDDEVNQTKLFLKKNILN